MFDYIDGGADGEVTLRENRRVWEDILFRPRNAVATPKCDTRVSVLGSELALPMILAPLGSSRMFHPEGELGAAKAASDAGIAYTLSTFSGYFLRRAWPGRNGRAALVPALSRGWAGSCGSDARPRVEEQFQSARGNH